MSYNETKLLYEYAKEFNCSDKELVWFFLKRGYNGISLVSHLTESEYNLARKHFLVPPPAIKPEPPVSKPMEQISKPALLNFNYDELLKKFDVAKIKKSPIKYLDAVLNVTAELLNILQDYEATQSETIAAFLKITLKLNVKYFDNPNLTPEENLLLAERQKFLAQRLELCTDEPKRKILLVKTQAENFFERLDEINGSDDSISELAELQAEPRADFEFLVENLSRIILNAQRKVNFFAAHKDLVSKVVEAQAAWRDNYKVFKTSLREELSAACRNESIDAEILMSGTKIGNRNVSRLNKDFCRSSSLHWTDIFKTIIFWRVCKVIVIPSTNFICMSGKIFIRSSHSKLAAIYKKNSRRRANFINWRKNFSAICKK